VIGEDIFEIIEQPDPIDPGTEGTIYYVGGGVINVNWDNGRTLGVVIGEDIFEIIEQSE
jgi:hypothetical protein